MKTAPKGRLRIRKWKGVVEYYYNENSNTDKKVITGKCSNTNGRYIKKSERKLAKEIAISKDKSVSQGIDHCTNNIR